MSCPSWQWHRTGSSWSPVQTLPVVPLWCDLGIFQNSRGNEAAANLRPMGLQGNLKKLGPGQGHSFNYQVWCRGMWLCIWSRHLHSDWGKVSDYLRPSQTVRLWVPGCIRLNCQLQVDNWGLGSVPSQVQQQARQMPAAAACHWLVREQLLTLMGLSDYLSLSQTVNPKSLCNMLYCRQILQYKIVFIFNCYI